MVITETEIFSDLIGDIYDAALDQTLWREVLRTSCEFVGGAAASLYSRNSAGRNGHTIFHWNLDGVKSYFNEYARIDPWATGQFMFEIGEVVSITDCIPGNEYLETRIYKEWAKPQGWVDYLAANLDKSTTTLSAIGIFRNEQQGLVDEEMRRRMRLIVPHLRRAALIGNILDAATSEAGALADTLHGLGTAVFLVDEESRVVFANASGQILLDEQKILRCINSILTAVDPPANTMLSDVFARARGGDVAVGITGIAVPLSSPPDERWLAHILPLTSGTRRNAGIAYSAVAAVFVRKVLLEPASSIEAISKLYRLTPTELRVLAAVVEVEGVAATAEVLGIAPSTVKTHLQRLFAKTGTNRQADLVKLVAVHASPLDRSR
jgi:DNA-binding CsgD family transcriptional regulator